MTMRKRSRGMWRHPCLVEIHVSDERPISIFKAENSIFIISFHMHYVWQGMKKNTNTPLKLLTESLTSFSKLQLFYSKVKRVGSSWHTYTTLHGDTHQMALISIITDFSISNLIFKALFNPKQKLKIKNQTYSFKTVPSSCVNDTDERVLQCVKEYYKWFPLYFFSLHLCRKNVENIPPST